MLIKSKLGLQLDIVLEITVCCYKPVLRRGSETAEEEAEEKLRTISAIMILLMNNGDSPQWITNSMAELFP